MRSAIRTENTEFNRAEFFARLVSLKPSSVLDIGCGGGDMLDRCAAAGIDATGVEPDAETANDPRILASPAEQLPFRDGEFDWCVMRFVPHHLPEPSLAFTEAMRVCRSGFLVAEPWFDTSLASQRTSLELDLWVKRQHRRGGMVHEAVLDADALIRALPKPNQYDIQIDTSICLRTWELDDVEAEVAPHLAALDAAHEDRRSFEKLREALARDGITWNGSVFVTARHK